jgi:hypothetical protein
VAWDDSVLCRLVHPALTAMSRDVPGYGAHAARELLNVITGAPLGSSEDHVAHLVPRGSTAGPARSASGPAHRPPSGAGDRRQIVDAAQHRPAGRCSIPSGCSVDTVKVCSSPGSNVTSASLTEACGASRSGKSLRSRRIVRAVTVTCTAPGCWLTAVVNRAGG